MSNVKVSWLRFVFEDERTIIHLSSLLNRPLKPEDTFQAHKCVTHARPERFQERISGACLSFPNPMYRKHIKADRDKLGRPSTVPGIILSSGGYRPTDSDTGTP